MVLIHQKFESPSIEIVNPIDCPEGTICPSSSALWEISLQGLFQDLCLLIWSEQSRSGNDTVAKPVPENLHLDNIFHDLFDIHLVVIERRRPLCAS